MFVWIIIAFFVFWIIKAVSLEWCHFKWLLAYKKSVILILPIKRNALLPPTCALRKEGGEYIGGKKNPPMIINWLMCWSEVLIIPKLADLPDMLFKISDFDKYKRNTQGQLNILNLLRKWRNKRRICIKSESQLTTL